MSFATAVLRSNWVHWNLPWSSSFTATRASELRLPSSLTGMLWAMTSAGASAAPTTVDHEWAEIQAVLSGDGSAYGRLISRHQPAISRYLWKFSRDPQVHEELVQTVFVEAYFQLRTFAGRSPLFHWLQVIATRVGYRYWRMRSRQSNQVSLEQFHEPPQHVEAADAAMASEAAAAVHASLSRLPPRDRLVLTLLHLEEKSIAEIAELTGWSKTMVKVQAYRARGKLAKLLKESES